MKAAKVCVALLIAAFSARAESQLTQPQTSVSARVTFAVVVAPSLHFDCAAQGVAAWTHAQERWRNRCVKSVTTVTAPVSSPTPSSPAVVTLSWP